MEKSSLPPPKVTPLVSLLSKIWLFVSVALFIAAASRVMWLALYFDLLALLFAVNGLHLAASIVIKIVIRATKGGIRAHQFTNSSIKFSVSTGIVIFFLFATFPTLSRMVFWDDYNRCRDQIMVIAEVIERYNDERHSLPGQLSVLVDEGYLDTLPQFLGSKDYEFAVVEDDTGRVFSVACPEPEIFSSRRGIFSKGKTYLEIKYIQGKGFIERKE